MKRLLFIAALLAAPTVRAQEDAHDEPAPPTAAMSRTWEPVSAPIPWIIPTPNAVRGPYELISSGSTCSWPWSRAPNRRHA